MAIQLTKTQISQGINRAMKDVVRKADSNGTKIVYDREVDSFKGSGKAMLSSVYKYARHIEGGKAGDDFVQLKTMEKALKNLGSALKKIADNKGDKDHKLDGTKAELGEASTAAASLARWIAKTA